ncbi:MAG: BREX-1 system adenine-specific DNA-methyltransferase PglX, partial [Saprospiraceae bacterium]|nr:BREX-1 system adenine-specific DNA-methyltransferase PglX [Saprospiraceae bacterium]
MDTGLLKKFAQAARRKLMQEVTVRLDQILQTQSLEHREKEEQIAKLKQELDRIGQKPLIEKVAYTWFNRLVAFRFMDMNDYTNIGVVTPRDGGTLPQLLQEAKAGHIDVDLPVIKERISGILSHQIPSSNPQNEVYKMLLVAECNRWHQVMPFMFERIKDYTELLMPDDLISPTSILEDIRVGMPEKDCQEVEVIGWLYQFYISEKKDQVFEGLKKNKKITPENIPAATQLFTPHWIVRYLVENSLGRLWMLNHPESKLVEQMDYYIQPEQIESDFLRIEKPEDIKICDPACGSGHMLTYAFDLLYVIYEESGYGPSEIPEKILTHNLYGIEIDERAGALAAFALMMKARARQRRFFRKPVAPNICVLQNINFTDEEIVSYMDFVGRDIFTMPLQNTLHQFEEADNFGSLIRPEVTDVDKMHRILKLKNVSGHLFLSLTHQKVLQAMLQADYLSPKYHVVIANPPYMGSKGMNGRLAVWVKDNYQESKSDLFAMFIERSLDLTQKHGMVAMITMQSWMFLSSFEALRARLLAKNILLSMAHLGARAFDSIGGEVVSTTAFVLENLNQSNYKGSYIRLVAGNSEAEKNNALRKAVKNLESGWHYRASATNFKKIPGSPIAYWVSDAQRKLFNNPKISDYGKVGVGLQTGNNNRYIRFWYEVNRSTFHIKNEKLSEFICWFKCNKGGEYRKWFGNGIEVILWKDDGSALKANTPSAVIRNESCYFKPCVTWSRITSGNISFRYVSEGFIHNDASCFIVGDTHEINLNLLAYLNSSLRKSVLEDINPTLNLLPGQVNGTPFLNCEVKDVERLIEIAKNDWDAFEISWNFTSLPLINADFRQSTLKCSYNRFRAQWKGIIEEMQRLEEENNQIFIEEYDLQDDLKPEVPLNEITLTYNPNYRYDIDRSDDELEALLLADTMRELISYAVGCMLGRYSLDALGLILANQGEDLTDYILKVGKELKEISFLPDDDAIIPVTEGKWFEDDLAARFSY